MSDMVGKEPPAQHKRIFKVTFYSRDDPATKGGILRGEAIEHEGQLWLVPLWLDSKDEAWSVPIIEWLAHVTKHR